MQRPKLLLYLNWVCVAVLVLRTLKLYVCLTVMLLEYLVTILAVDAWVSDLKRSSTPIESCSLRIKGSILLELASNLHPHSPIQTLLVAVHFLNLFLFPPQDMLINTRLLLQSLLYSLYMESMSSLFNLHEMNPHLAAPQGKHVWNIFVTSVCAH